MTSIFQGHPPQNKGHLGSRYVYIYIYYRVFICLNVFELCIFELFKTMKKTPSLKPEIHFSVSFRECTHFEIRSLHLTFCVER